MVEIIIFESSETNQQLLCTILDSALKWDELFFFPLGYVL